MIKIVNKEQLPDCPVATTIEIIGSKWKILIVRDLLSGPKRYSELLKSLSGISHKVLTSTLKSMVHDGIVNRNEYEGKMLRVEYSLSELGESMKPVIQIMEDWGIYYKKL